MSNYSYLTDPVYNTLPYTRPMQAYYIIFGSLSALGNLYLILLFGKFSKLREIQCNWLIIFLCVDDVMIGKYGHKKLRQTLHISRILHLEHLKGQPSNLQPYEKMIYSERP
jgi:hypothetical protein